MLAVQIYRAMVAAKELDADQIRQLTTMVDAGAHAAGGQRRSRPEDDYPDPKDIVMSEPDVGSEDMLRTAAGSEAAVSRC